ncbi:MAG TPA: A/G-specific adenine glycosylase [Candidatus Paceibacterota bacterium]|nr:A/G-specific adenine glycosylase [Candidatus Paceibacterota bacterium]
MMLQQTQVPRVIPKFRAFIRVFPTFRALASAKSVEVLKLWQGLGYNRRALMLHRCANLVVNEYGGRMPRDVEKLRRLPGLGAYTAGAVYVFAFDRSWPLLETNIRRAYLHHFFPGQENVPDSELLPVIERTMDRAHPRRWYSALMDYGSWLAQRTTNPNRRSRHYTRQSRFEGSDRQLRGKILRAMLAAEPLPADRRTARIAAELKNEGFVVS